jgi:hypothetical protein
VTFFRDGDEISEVPQFHVISKKYAFCFSDIIAQPPRKGYWIPCVG